MRRVLFSICCVFGFAVAGSAQRRFLAVERGLASWYGEPYHGQKSASGEAYDQEQMTAAHIRLPFGTRVRVRRLDGDRSVVVRINDRGPFAARRIIDVSRAAAVRLGMIRAGVVPVALEIVGVPTPPSIFTVELALFRNPDERQTIQLVR